MITKYRAWDREEEKMIEWEELRETLTFFYGCDDEYVDLLLYTGFSDIDNDEVYSGDYLERLNMGQGVLERHVIEWEKGSFFLGDEHLIDANLKEWKIVGNIYKNKKVTGRFFA